jgi:iron complex outermembrane receptor protein
MTKIQIHQAYSLLDIKASYTFTILKILKTELSTGINNAGNTKYAAVFYQCSRFWKRTTASVLPRNPRIIMEVSWPILK